MNKCKHCGDQVKSMPHHCRETGNTYRDNDNSFLETLITGVIVNELLTGTDPFSTGTPYDSPSDNPIDFGGGDFGGGGAGDGW